MTEHLDFYSHIRDEIALEGLDGITTEALWKRLNNRPNFKEHLAIDEHSKSFMWSLLVQDEELLFYKLNEPRKNFFIFNRYEYVDKEVGMILESENDFEDIYPCIPLQDSNLGIRGSCSTYNTREDVTNQVTNLFLPIIEKQYGNALVIVASQLLRNKALGINSTIDKFYDLTLLQYVMLERVGRSRTLGEITYGKNSLACVNKNPKSMFYIRKRLLKLNLITKQDHQQKTCRGTISSSSLLHLARFFVLRRSKFIVLIQKVVEILKNKPGNWHPLASVKIQIGMGDVSSKKIFKNSEFSKYIRTITIPYREVYKGAAEREWKFKVRDEEKTIRCLQLIDPDLDLENVCAPKDEEPNSDAEEENTGILDQSKLVLGESLMYQAYRAVENAGPDGLSQIELAKKLGQTKLDARTICRNLQKRNVVYSLMKDIGRQRVSRYVSNKYSSTGHLLQEFEVERQKMREIVESTSINRSDSEDIQISYQAPSTSRVMESDPVDNIDISLEIFLNGVTTYATVHEECLSHVSPDTAKGKEKMRLVIKPISETKDPPSSLKKNHQTARVLKRRNIIMREIKRKMVIDDTVYLQKFIMEQEIKEDLDGKMDKKSLSRLLLKISRDGFVKTILVIMKSAAKERRVTFVADSTIGIDNQLLLDALERHKHKFLVHVSKDNPTVLKPMVKTEPPTETFEFISLQRDAPSVGASVLELKQMLTLPDGTKLLGKPDTTPEMTLVGIKGKVGPKFIRIQEFHKLLFYLVYGYEGSENLDQEEAWFSVINSSPENLSSECTDEYQTIYVPELSWKMFIPPLPTHQSGEDTDSMSGWCFMVDILLRLPLCIFVSLVNVNFQYSLLDEYLRHPIKKNLLIKFLPPELRKVILHNRRYVTYVMDLCQQLCYIGLGQYGKQIMKERDQVFFYVNKNAILVDTTTSGPGYHHISTDKEYVKKYYKFDAFKDVITYWYDMWTICMHTPLGGHSCVQGKRITIQSLVKKKEIIESIASRYTKEAQERDVGYIPGDGRGSGGLDSAMFSHLKRNWTSTTIRTISTTPAPYTGYHYSDTNKENSSSEKVFSYADYLKNSCQPNSPATKPPAPIRGFRNVRLSLYKPDKKNECEEVNLKVPVGLVSSSKNKLKKKLGDEISAAKERPPLKKKKTNKECYQREVKTRKKAPRKPYYDEKDRAALGRMHKLRVDWLPAEDSVLLLCKVASVYLFPTKRHQIISFSAVRDILHKRYPESHNKTSRACQRRINYMLKNSVTEENVAVYLEELKQDPEITKDFQPQSNPLNQASINGEYGELFKHLVNRLIIKFTTNTCRTVPDLPSNTEEFEKAFHIIRTSTSLNEGLKVGPINTIADIDRYVVHALLFSSLCTSQDKESWAFQLYLAYQKYPQSLLNSVLTSIRDSKMISYKKHFNRSSYSKQCLPLSTSPFQLSLTFIYTFHMKYQYEIFSECWDFTKNLVNQKRNYFCDIESSRKALLGHPQEKTQKKKRCKKRKRKSSNVSIENLPVTTEGQSPQQHEDETVEVPSVENEKLLLTDDQRTEDVAEEGVKIIINQEGGFCAAIVALMATQRLSFEVVIPDQIIRIDRQNSNVESRKKLLDKILYHEKISGRKFVLPEELSFQVDDEEDILPNEDVCSEEKLDEEVSDFDNVSSLDKEKTANGNSFALSLENETNHPSTSKSSTSLAVEENSSSIPEENFGSKESDFSNDELKASTTSGVSRKLAWALGLENAKKLKLVKEDDSITGSLSATKATTSNDNDQTKPSDDNDASGDEKGMTLKHSRSRLKMYIMREQLVSAYESNYPQWESDNVLIHACQISCRLTDAAKNEEPISLDLQSLLNDSSLIKHFLPVCQQKLNEALRNRKKVILSDWIKWEDAVQIWRNEEHQSSSYIEMAQTIYDMIDSCKELGASTKQIKDHLEGSNYSYHPMELVRNMENINLLLKVGVETFRWVTIRNSKPWLIHTNKVSRNEMKTMESNRKGGVYELSEKPSVEKKPPKETCVANQPTKRTHDDTFEESTQSVRTSKRLRLKGGKADKESQKIEHLQVEEMASEETNTNGLHVRSKLALKYPKLRKETKSMSDVQKNMDGQASKREEIAVLVRPWVRLNGCLNRRVMDRFLGAILAFVMERPGITALLISKKFWPAMQPAHTYELLDTLKEIGCVERYCIKKSVKCSLFSKREESILDSVEDYDFDEGYFYGATVDSILKLSMFIGDRKYNHDFLAHCR